MLVIDLASQILSSLRDEGSVQFTTDYIHGLIFESELFAISKKMDLNTVRGDFLCEAGSEQDISGMTPAPLRILDVLPREGHGNVVRIPRAAVSRFGFSYKSRPASSEIEGFIIDDREDTIFETIPPAALNAPLRVVYSARPSAYGTVGAGTQTTLTDDYWPYIIDYVLARCLEEDDEANPNYSKSMQHKNSALQFLGLSTQEELRVSAKEPRSKA